MAINPQTKMDAENNGEQWLDPENLIADWIDYTQCDAKEEMIRLFVNESGKTMDWLIESYDFAFGEIKAFFHPNQWVVWASYEGEKTAMYNAAMEKAKAANDKNDYMLELTATELLMDEDAIIGVKAETMTVQHTRVTVIPSCLQPAALLEKQRRSCNIWVVITMWKV